MAGKIIILFAAFTIAFAIPIEYQEYQHQDDDNSEHQPVEYQFKYGVQDHHTGDFKEHQESRKGDHVEGKYELVEPDGHKRIVQYTSDAHNGFNAVVHREPTNIKVPVPVQHNQYNQHQQYQQQDQHQQHQQQQHYQQYQPQIYTTQIQQHVPTTQYIQQESLNLGQIGLQKYQQPEVVAVKSLEPAPVYQNQHDTGNSHSHVSFENSHIQYRY